MSTNGFLKIHKWWTSHYGTMMAFIYFVLAASSSPPTLVQLLSSLLLFTVGSIGIASLGQLLNDLGDIHQDMRSGAPNLLASQGISTRLLIFLSVATAAITPWIWLPMAPVILLLLSLEIILFIIYSLPPLRLKGRGLLGLIADSLYAYVITNSVAILVFAKLASYTVPLWLTMVFVAWWFVFGIDQILQHQMIDESRDRADGITTFVAQLGWLRCLNLSLKVFMPIEIISFVLLIILD